MDIKRYGKVILLITQHFTTWIIMASYKSYWFKMKLFENVTSLLVILQSTTVYKTIVQNGSSCFCMKQERPSLQYQYYIITFLYREYWFFYILLANQALSVHGETNVPSKLIAQTSITRLSLCYSFLPVVFRK